MFDKLKEKLLTVVKTQDEVQQEIEKMFPYEYKDMPGLVISLSREGANKQAISSLRVRRLIFCVSGSIISPQNTSNQPI